jgi:DNA/RNA endonuclease YhcR with UshA esterase domain
MSQPSVCVGSSENCQSSKRRAKLSHRSADVFLILLVVMVAIAPALAQKPLTAAEAKGHVGEQATVCGKVASTRYAESSRGSPTFLNLDQPYPSPIFTLVIWGSDRAKFGDPETIYRGKRVCVTGKISAYRGVPEIVMTEASQIRSQ